MYHYFALKALFSPDIMKECLRMVYTVYTPGKTTLNMKLTIK